MSRLLLSAASLVALLSAGCGPSGPKLVEANGILTMNGQPLEKVRVEFWPEKNGPNSTGVTDENGEFTLETLDGKQKGAVPGRHRVTIVDLSLTEGFQRVGSFRDQEDVDMTQGRKPRIANLYVSVTNTKLSAEVPEDGSQIELSVEPFPEK